MPRAKYFANAMRIMLAIKTIFAKITLPHPGYHTMPKLQLYISKSLRGYKRLVNFNPSEEVSRHIAERRDVLGLLDYDTSHIHLFYLLSYLEEGTLLSVMRTIPDGPGDHLEASIFIPSGIDAGDCLANVVATTAAKISNPGVSADDLNELRALFSSDYPVAEEIPVSLPSEGPGYALFRLGGDNGPSLADLLGNIYQPAFAAYRGVVLCDAADTDVTTTIPDISRPQLQSTVVLPPPAPSPEGFVPHLQHHLFDRPYVVAAGEPLTIVWRRAGFEPVSNEITPDTENAQTVTADTSGSRKAISPGSFYITPQGSRQLLEDYTVTVNGREITGQTLFTYTELLNARVEITAPGYYPYTGNFDLASTTQALVQMRELRKIYRFELPVKASEQASPIRFEIHTRRPMEASPVEGYAIAGGTPAEGAKADNYLVYVGGKGRNAIRLAGICSAVALLIGFFAGWMAFHVDTGENAEEVVAKVATQTQTPEKKKSKDAPKETKDASTAKPAAKVAEAVKYLDSNSYWEQSEMEKIPALKGLFDDMNNYRFDRIVSYWKPLLKDSRNFRRIASAAKGAPEKRDPRTGVHAPTYNTRPGDTRIQWIGYANWIDP